MKAAVPLLLVVAGAGAWLFWPGDAPTPAVASTPVAEAHAGSLDGAPVIPAALPSQPEAGHDPRPVREPDFDENPPGERLDPLAIASLRATLDGDPRAPAIDADAPVYEHADEQTRASPTRYRDWQQQKRMERYGSWLDAVGPRLEEMDEQLSFARENGVSAEQLEAGEEKRAKLEQAREMLLSRHPELAAPPQP